MTVHPTFDTELGYLYHCHDDRSLPGYARLDVILKPSETRKHFDPVSVRMPVAGTNGIEIITILHPWHGAYDGFHICAGRIILTDRKGKHVEAFSFGGDLRIESQPDRTFCVLTSSAPILPLDYKMDTGVLLAEEAEGLLARRRAAAGGRLHDFESRLIEIDPKALYCALLVSLERKLNHPLIRWGEGFVHLYQAIHSECVRLREQDSCMGTTSLEDLL